MSTLYVDNLQPNLGSQVEIPDLKHNPGSLVQIKYAQSLSNTTSQANNTTNYVVVTGCSITITPKYTNSLLVVSGKINCYVTGGSYPYGFGSVFRDGIDTSSSTYGNGYLQGDVDVGQLMPFGCILTSGSTSPTTLDFRVRLGGGGATLFQVNSSDKLMSVMEIAQ